MTDYGYEETLHAFQKSATKLGVDQIDLLILHQAVPSAFDRTIQAYKALEKLLADGAVRAIGVSNFLPIRLDALLAATDVVPAVNQIELHPYNVRPELQAANPSTASYAGVGTDRRDPSLQRRHQHPAHRHDRFTTSERSMARRQLR